MQIDRTENGEESEFPFPKFAEWKCVCVCVCVRVCVRETRKLLEMG